MLRLAALALGLLAVPAGAAKPESAPVPAPKLGTISARLFYQNSGKLSRDLLAGKEPFVGWNTVIGEGPVEEPASDLLIDVTMIGGGSDEQSIEGPLTIWVTDKAGKIIASRKFPYMLLPYQGALHNPLWLRDIPCAGKLTVHARFRKQVRTASLTLDCGE